MNAENLNDESFSILEHISENLVGVFLFSLVFIIIYAVDYISRINALIYAMPSPIPGVANSSPIMKPFIKSKKSKK